MVIITLHSLLFTTIFFVLHDMAQSGAAGWASAAKAAAHSIVTNPVIIAIAVGLSWAALGLGLPSLCPRSLTCSVMQRSRRRCLRWGHPWPVPGRGKYQHAMTMAVIKLVVHPLVVFAAAHWLFNLTSLELAVVTLTAALPVG